MARCQNIKATSEAEQEKMPLVGVKFDPRYNYKNVIICESPILELISRPIGGGAKVSYSDPRPS